MHKSIFGPLGELTTLPQTPSHGEGTPLPTFPPSGRPDLGE